MISNGHNVIVACQIPNSPSRYLELERTDIRTWSPIVIAYKGPNGGGWLATPLIESASVVPNM